MRPEEIRSRGAALAERTRTHVDASQRLDMMMRAHRRSRIMAVAVTAAMLLVVVAGVILLASESESPVVTVPPTTVPSTTPELGSLPVEVFMVLRGDYTVNTESGVCEGSGPLAGIGEGSVVHVQDESVFESADDAPTVALPAGVEITEDDPRASFLLPGSDQAACVFTLPDLGYDITEYENISLFPEADPDVSMGAYVSGQRVVYTFGDSP